MNIVSGKKKWIAAALAVIALAAAAAALIYYKTGVYVGRGVLGKTRFSVFEKEIDASGMDIDDVLPFRRCGKLEKLDIRGNDVSADEYKQLCESLKDCEILWDIPLQGQKIDCLARSLTLSGLTREDIDTLGMFRGLEEIDATACEPSEILVEAKERLGGDIDWKVAYSGMVLDKNVTVLDLKDMNIGSAGELEYALTFCPSVTSVDLTGSGIEDRDKIELRKKHPGSGLRWDFSFFGDTVSTEEDLIDISNKQITDTDSFRKLLDNFSRVSKLVMCDCGLSNEEMEKLCGEYPDIKFVWRVYLGSWSLRTDATHFCTNILTGNEYKLKSEDIEVLKYCTDLEHLDIGHSFVTDISALSGLTKLKTLIIISGGEGVRDISPLAGMVHMQYLELFLNHITDISPLANMHELLDLNLTFNQISDITPLLGLTQLERCWLARNEISEADMKKLEETLPMCEFNFTVWASTDGGWRIHERYFEMREYFGYKPEIGRAAANIPWPYDELPENYMTHLNKYYKEKEKQEKQQ